MAKLNFDEVANLINYSRTTEIDLKHVAKEDNKWVLYKGVNKVPNFNYNFNLLYLYSEFTIDSALNAAKAIKNLPSTIIIYAPSILPNKIEELKKTLYGPVSVIQDLKSFLVAFIQIQVKNYTNQLQDLNPVDFIAPHYETPSGFQSSRPNPMLTFFTEEYIEQKEIGALGILLAEPGQGKTYTTRYLISRLINNDKYIPIYINSPQWLNIMEEDLSSLWKTIANSFRYFNSPIDWIDGHEEEFINISLKVGIFRIIFDGFDEYILWNKGKVNAIEVIKTLHNLTLQTSSRILITSRTSFWKANITDVTEFNNLDLYAIKPFDLSHARNYFEKKLTGNPKAINNAIEIFSKLKNLSSSNDTSDFAGRGFVLNLISDLSSGETLHSKFDENTSIVQWIIKALCIREEIRQKLPLNPQNQIFLLRELAEHKAGGNAITSEYINIVCLLINLTDEDIKTLIGDNTTTGKLKDHPLIGKEIDKDEWYFKHPQIEYNLIAEHLLNYIKENNKTGLTSFFNSLYLSGTILNDLADVICEQIIIHPSKETIISYLKDFNLGVSETKNNFDVTPLKINVAMLLSTIVTINIINKLFDGDKKTRTEKLLFSYDNDIINFLQFSDTISSFDFSGITFNSCRFDNTVFINCIFDNNTKFKNCYFLGGTIIKCEKLGFAIFEDCEFDKEAEAVFSAECIKCGTKKYSNIDLIRDLELFIKKFVPKEGVFKNVKKDYLLKGPLSVSLYKDEILKEMAKHVIDDGTKSFSVKHKAKHSIQNFLTNGIFSDELGTVYVELKNKLLR